jgi:hypothetical protein
MEYGWLVRMDEHEQGIIIGEWVTRNQEHTCHTS